MLQAIMNAKISLKDTDPRRAAAEAFEARRAASAFMPAYVPVIEVAEWSRELLEETVGWDAADQIAPFPLLFASWHENSIRFLVGKMAEVVDLRIQDCGNGLGDVTSCDPIKDS